MTRGRPPKGRDFHLAAGSFRPDRHGPLVEPGPAPGSPPWRPLRLKDRPRYLTRRAAELWGEVLPGLALHRVDVYFLGVWCTLQAEIETGLAGMRSGDLRLLRYLARSFGL